MTKPLTRAEQERMASLYEQAVAGDQDALSEARQLAARTRLKPFRPRPYEPLAQERRQRLLAWLSAAERPLTLAEISTASGLYGSDRYSAIAHQDLKVLIEQGHLLQSEDGPLKRGKPLMRWANRPRAAAPRPRPPADH